MQLVYFAHDLSDAAVGRRVRMLQAGGANLKLLGFRRTAAPIEAVEGIPAVDLGRTTDGKLAERFALVLRRSLEAGRWRDIIRSADVLLARNLEMATIADVSRDWARSSVRLVYECLDIHGSLLGNGVPSKLLRKWEKRLLTRSAALVVSSPGFINNYFGTLGIDLPPIILAENKRVLSNGQMNRPQSRFDPAPPWKIGWFGIIRCVESFQILHGLAQRHPNLVDIEIRGRPNRDLQLLIDRHLPLTNIRFSGAYTQADLATIYQQCHFTWAVDYFQKGQNSDWLLPNRIYEGGFYNRPAIALAGTETAKWLERRGAGIIIPNPAALDALFVGLSSNQYADVQRLTHAIPTNDLVDNIANSKLFVAQIAGRAS